VPVVANLRHHDIEPLFNEQTHGGGLPTSLGDELKLLWQLANACEGGAASRRRRAGQQRLQLRVEGDLATATGKAASRSASASAAARSTSWSPS
jgi:exoribonuclease-2